MPDALPVFKAESLIGGTTRLVNPPIFKAESRMGGITQPQLALLNAEALMVGITRLDFTAPPSTRVQNVTAGPVRREKP